MSPPQHNQRARVFTQSATQEVKPLTHIEALFRNDPGSLTVALAYRAAVVISKPNHNQAPRIADTYVELKPAYLRIMSCSDLQNTVVSGSYHLVAPPQAKAHLPLRGPLVASTHNET